ncbi:MAG: DUF2877 domain-containing protein [Chloroflexota bacterium]|nr:DUF2877 domain-containing protein [Chloroflexota bacterium]
MWAVARSISRSLKERLHLQKGQLDGHVLAAFEHACDLVTRDGDLVALVSPRIGDGPLNIVVDAAEIFTRVAPGTPVTQEGKRLWVGELEIDLGRAAVWEPRPDWETLRARRAATASYLPRLRALCLRHVPASSLLALLETPSAVLPRVQDAAKALREGWAGDLERLREGAIGLAGLGSGLTPAGDDFLTGVMVWAWLAHPTPALFCRALVEAAVPCTTTLSAAFLRAAGRGECSASWHILLAALSEGQEAKFTAAAQKILTHGATSGADSLTGFLYPSLWER